MSFLTRFCSVLLFLLPISAFSYEPPTTLEKLEKASTADAMVQSFTTTTDSPMGIAGLWGIEIDLILKTDADTVYTAVSDIRAYPLHIKKVVSNRVLREIENGVVTDYVEESMGMKFSTTMEWLLDPYDRRVTARSIGEDDSVSFTAFTVTPTAQPGFSHLNLVTYAQMKWMPDFLLEMISSTAGAAVAKQYRTMIQAYAKQETQ